MRGCEQLVAGAQREGLQDCIDAFGRVRHEAKIVILHSQPLSDRPFCCGDQLARAPPKQLDGFGFDSGAPSRLFIEDAARHRAEGAVIEKRDLFVQKPLRTNAGSQRRGWGWNTRAHSGDENSRNAMTMVEGMKRDAVGAESNALF